MKKRLLLTTLAALTATVAATSAPNLAASPATTKQEVRGRAALPGCNWDLKAASDGQAKVLVDATLGMVARYPAVGVHLDGISVDRKAGITVMLKHNMPRLSAPGAVPAWEIIFARKNLDHGVRIRVYGDGGGTATLADAHSLAVYELTHCVETACVVADFDATRDFALTHAPTLPAGASDYDFVFGASGMPAREAWSYALWRSVMHPGASPSAFQRDQAELIRRLGVSRVPTSASSDVAYRE